MGAVFLATKSEEHVRTLRDVINVFVHLQQVRDGRPSVPVSISSTVFSLITVRLPHSAGILGPKGSHHNERGLDPS